MERFSAALILTGLLVGCTASTTNRPTSPGRPEARSGDLLKGPNGETIYPADWFQEPTGALLEKHLTSRKPRTGWGQIACKTAAQYHVEDCYILGEEPRGSGFGQSVLNAAPEFLVLPPRINGEQQVGTWVSICIKYFAGRNSNAPEGACGSPRGIPMQPVLTEVCKTEDVQRFVGQKASSELGAKLLVVSGAKALRWAPPRSAMTTDFRADRLTVAYDDGLTVISARCG